MGKLKAFFDNQKTELQGLTYNYTLTLISVAVLSILACIGFELDDISPLQDFMIFLSVFAAGNLFIETIFIHPDEDKNWAKLGIWYTVSGGIALFWTIIINQSESIAKGIASAFHTSEEMVQEYFAKWFAVYIIVIVAVFFYQTIKKNEVSVEIYFARAIFGLLKVWGLFFVIYGAIISVFACFSTLIVDIDYWDFMDNLTVLLAGFVYFPYSLLTLTDTEEENSKFTRGLINFVLMPCVWIAMAIIYLYIGKIVFFEGIPSNVVFEICFTLFYVGGPVWMISYGFLRDKAEENGDDLTLYGKLVKNAKYIYAPIILLEIAVLAMRVLQYGFTEERYMGVFIIIFQIIYVAWDFIYKLVKKEDEVKQEGLIYVLMTMLIIMFVCPIINVSKIPYYSQKALFEKNMEMQDYGSAWENYDYLYHSTYGKLYLQEKYTEKEREEISKQLYEAHMSEEDTEEYADNRDIYISCNVPYDESKLGMDIDGYTNLYPFTYDSSGDVVTEDMQSSLCISYCDKSYTVNVDVRDVIQEALGEDVDFIQYSRNADMKYRYIQVDTNQMLVVERVRYNYNVATKKVSSLRLEGYVLVK